MNRFFMILTIIACCLSIVSAQNGIAGIRPNHVTQEEMTQDILALYNDFKDRHLRNTPSGNYFIYARTFNYIGITHSQAHGFGMIIFAQMAKHDPDARKIFDGMNQLRKAQPSTINSNLMSWLVLEKHIDNTNPEENDARRYHSGTNGELDMAYALLLAYRQWNDSTYKNEAIKIINALKESCISQDAKRVKYSDMPMYSDMQGLETRSSDWMPGHFRAFAKVTNDNFWLETADTVYSLLRQVSHSETGLIPSFVTGIPAIPNYYVGGGEQLLNSNYSFHASQIPWRLALDYAFYATPDAKYNINKISRWLRNEVGADPNRISSSYYLDGRVLQTHLSDIALAVFIAKFASGMIADSNNQEFLNKAYDGIRNVARHHNYYETAIQILNMLFITGNWIDPVAENQIIPTAIRNITENPHTISAAFAGIRNGQINLRLTAGNYTVELFNPQGRMVGNVNISATSGVNATGLRTDNLARGVYILNVKQAGISVLQRKISVR